MHAWLLPLLPCQSADALDAAAASAGLLLLLLPPSVFAKARGEKKEGQKESE